MTVLGSPLSCSPFLDCLKILREVGSVAYAKGITTVSGGATSRFAHIRDQIQMHFVGPDCYWHPNETTKKPTSSSSHFGNAWWIPFPPTVVRLSPDIHLYMPNAAPRSCDTMTVAWQRCEKSVTSKPMLLRTPFTMSNANGRFEGR